jgi:hypothetical protein
MHIDAQSLYLYLVGSGASIAVYQALAPPSTGMIAPVMKFDASDASGTTMPLRSTDARHYAQLFRW